MKPLCAAGAALGLILGKHTVPAQAHPRHDPGAIASGLDRTADVPTSSPLGPPRL